MKKLSNLTESVWADIHKRSNGTQTRREDDVDLLDAQGFVEYLRDIYKNVNTDFYIFKDLNDVITVPMFETELGTKSTWFIKYNCTDNSVLIWDHFLNQDDKLFDKLRKEYKVTKCLIKSEFINNFLITPKTGKSSNKFFIEIIDFLLENAFVFFHRILVKKDVNESVWSDIHKRSSGQQIRKEDLMVDLYKHITSNYHIAYKNTDEIIYMNNHIYVPIYKILGLNSYASIKIYMDNVCFSSIDVNKYKSGVIRKFVNPIKDDINYLYDRIKKEYSPEISEFNGIDHWVDFKITPKNGVVTKMFCDEIINFILDNLKVDTNVNILKILEKI